MYKRITRWISVMLVLALLAGLFPTALLGNLVQRASAAERRTPPQGYACEAPQETQGALNVTPPPTVIDETDSEPQPASPDAPSETPAAPQLKIPEQTEEDSRFIALLRSYTVFSQLSGEDAAFLCTYKERFYD